MLLLVLSSSTTHGHSAILLPRGSLYLIQAGTNCTMVVVQFQDDLRCVHLLATQSVRSRGPVGIGKAVVVFCLFMREHRKNTVLCKLRQPANIKWVGGSVIQAGRHRANWIRARRPWEEEEDDDDKC